MDNKPTYDELAAHAERLREVLITVNRILHDDCFTVAMPAKDYIELALSTYPAQSLNHITEQLGCSEQAINELKAQVEDETIKEYTEYLKCDGYEIWPANVEGYSRKYKKDGE